jgi:2-isopropylmalate synthase
MSDRLVIFDTTLRDGEQAPGFSLRVEEKVQLARQLEALGVDIIEAGFPISSEDDAESVRRVSDAVTQPVVAALARCAAGDVERAGECLKTARRSRIHTFIATSDLHLASKLRMTRETCLEAAVRAVRQARTYTDDVEFSAEDATRSDLDFLCRVVETVIEAGATTVNLPDTVGYSTPDEIGAFFRTILSRVPNADKAIWSAHCHDDLGLAVANTLAAIAAGVRQVECTINGIGERAGNASLEEIVMVTRVRPDRVPVETRIASQQLFPTSQLLTELTGESVQANKAVVGRNAFAHEAGIHQDGMLKDRRTYEIMSPADVGVPQSTLVLGKHSGRHAVQKSCERLGLTLSRRDLDEVYRRMVALADRQKHISDDDLLGITSEVCGATAARAAESGVAGRRFGA